MIYITGDMHREFYRLHDIEKNKDNMLIILGDAGINYYLDERDKLLKEQLNSYNIKLFCVQGNHEENCNVADSRADGCCRLCPV